ncbi:hypothetical protein WN944_017243 [Citrus x changshan-huyou]|uniref:Uncharacterized protein n=1 Tax=Citrus x changshan-huyou TaxID=2935761 RepID=A0AAP0MCH6_9ROSI
MKSFTSTRRSRSASKNKYAVPGFPFNFEWPSITSEPEENNPSETKMFDNIFKTEKKSGQKANHGGVIKLPITKDSENMKKTLEKLKLIDASGCEIQAVNVIGSLGKKMRPCHLTKFIEIVHI